MEDKFQIVQYAGITVMFPAALVIAAWLWVGASKRIAFVWVAVLVSAYLVVGASKILFKGWGIGLHDLGIAVFSGHAMNACLVFTVMLNLLCQQLDHRLRWPVLGAGLVATWWFAIHYVAHTIHPLPEAIAGALIGSVAACVFLFSLKKNTLGKIPRPALVMGLAVVLVFNSMPKYTAERLLDHIAITLSGADQAFRHSS
ncbi:MULTISPECIES: hypothetical protein [Pseudomonas]|uniref:Phosphatase PAP2 family protein n=1 Tax=Pseudomonas psychrophila TaxID=122355 RepID=A0ABY0VNN4_9PSED|nr:MULTISPECIES: hypothetical protein [Pseudomonas]KAB0493304.1 hypothetical protein F7Q95_02650 [Pseudomonas psychrophila]KMN02822.1 hypothetical protein TU76_03450 [Pseudomonas psychrophila]MDY7583922.1 hypothetical protein [Pseudomonas sp. CCI3.1]MEB0068255.1 hypothetical protein [Pseudomonas sp. CCI3.1]MEB0073910.1 hypothetical protein [Pseudomonas sp. CCI1.4]